MVAFDPNMNLNKIDDSLKISYYSRLLPTYYNDGILFMNIFDFLLKQASIDI